MLILALQLSVKYFGFLYFTFAIITFLKCILLKCDNEAKFEGDVQVIRQCFIFLVSEPTKLATRVRVLCVFSQSLIESIVAFLLKRTANYNASGVRLFRTINGISTSV